MNGRRARSESFSDDDLEERNKRTITTGQEGTFNNELESHYDIFALPSRSPLYATPSLSSPSPTSYQSLSLFIVHRTSGLSTGLGILYCLSFSSSPIPTLTPAKDPGFNLSRESAVGYEVNSAVQLGWIAVDELGLLEESLLGTEVPRVGGRGGGEECEEWVKRVCEGWEMKGWVSNSGLLLEGVMRRR